MQITKQVLPFFAYNLRQFYRFPNSNYHPSESFFHDDDDDDDDQRASILISSFRPPPTLHIIHVIFISFEIEETNVI